MVCILDVANGGETDFIRLGFQIRPQSGTAVLWHNVIVESVDSVTRKMKFDGTMRENRMLHASIPVQGNEEKFAVVFYIKNYEMVKHKREEKKIIQSSEEKQSSVDASGLSVASSDQSQSNERNDTL